MPLFWPIFPHHVLSSWLYATVVSGHINILYTASNLRVLLPLLRLARLCQAAPKACTLGLAERMTGNKHYE